MAAKVISRQSKLGIQVCYDMEFDDGWKELARVRQFYRKARTRTAH